MPDESHRFHTRGPSWAERAKLGGLRAVLSPTAPPRRNEFLHGVHTFGAKQALKHFSRGALVVDFGCGNGRFTRLFAAHGCRVLGTEITEEMLEQARSDCPQAECSFSLTDGIAIPLPDAHVDAIWCCGVLRYSLFVANPAYDQIANEMFRVLRPGGKVINLEVYVDVPPQVFCPGFEKAGFRTEAVHVLQRYGSRPERLVENRPWPNSWVSWLAQRSAQLRYHFDDPHRPAAGLRDYLFLWTKPGGEFPKH